MHVCETRERERREGGDGALHSAHAITLTRCITLTHCSGSARLELSIHNESLQIKARHCALTSHITDCRVREQRTSRRPRARYCYINILPLEYAHKHIYTHAPLTHPLYIKCVSANERTYEHVEEVSYSLSALGARRSSGCARGARCGVNE